MTESPARKGRSAPRIDLSGAEWKALVAAWLAVVYVASWFAIRTGNEGDSSATPAPAEARPSAAGTAVRPVPGGVRAAPARPRARPRTDVVSGASSRRW